MKSVKTLEIETFCPKLSENIEHEQTAAGNTNLSNVIAEIQAARKQFTLGPFTMEELKAMGRHPK